MSELSRWIRPIEEVKESYNFLMGWTEGKPREWYCGVEGVTFIWHGAWGDPEIGYKGYAINEPTATDFIYEKYREDTGNDEPDEFAGWLRENKEDWFSELDELIAQYEEEQSQRQFKVSNISWCYDTDEDDEPDLPTEVLAPKGMIDEDDITEWLSDEYEYLVDGYHLEEVSA